MSKVTLIKLAKTLKRRYNIIIGTERTPYVSYSRRINSVKTRERICAMTFDDGPMKMNATGSDRGLTEILIETLEKHNAKGTFDVIGTTENNYPDKEGKLGTPSWSGVSYDHYPCFNMDKLAGAVNCPELIERIIKGGHQITNHTYAHVLYGKKNVIYSQRNTFSSFGEARDDLLKLDSHLLENHGYKMSMSRPPHYVENISKGLDVYDLYQLENYQYLGASFDGSGWLPCSDYQKEVDAMTDMLEKTLKSDPDALCGQIIFQKDGYNMALRTPVADGLDKQLDVLDYYGYRVVTVNELFEKHPFTDVDEYDENFDLFCEISKTKAIVYNDNTLKPEQIMTLGELAVLIAPRNETVDKRIDAIINGKNTLGPLPSHHVYSGAVNWCINNNLLTIENTKQINKKVEFKDLESLADYLNLDSLKGCNFTRRNIIKATKKYF